MIHAYRDYHSAIHWNECRSEHRAMGQFSEVNGKKEIVESQRQNDISATLRKSNNVPVDRFWLFFQIHAEQELGFEDWGMSWGLRACIVLTELLGLIPVI